MRPAYEDETPAFGSVWLWGKSGNKYIALSLTPNTNRDRAMLNAIRISEFPRSVPPKVQDGMTWGRLTPEGPRPVTGWMCIDEGYVDA